MRLAVLLTPLLLAAPMALAAGTATPKPPPPPKVDLASVPPSAAARPPKVGAEEHPVLARLLVDRDVVAPGETFRLGVLLEQREGWHTYWKSPGDIGMPTDITWKLPDGSQARPYQYPVPQRFEDTGIVSYGYEDQILLFSEVTLPASTPAGTVDLGASVAWLVCESSCIPGEVELSLPVTVGPPGGPGKLAPLFDHYAKQHPTPVEAVKEFSASTVAHASALRPEEPFKVAIELKPASGKLGAPPPTGTWPTFTPIVSSDVMVFGTQVKATPGGGLVAIIEGETLPMEPMPEKSAFGGLFQVDIGGRTVRTEVSADVPWVPKGAAVTPSDSPIWKEIPAPPGGSERVVELPSEVAPLPSAAPVSFAWMLGFAFMGGLLLNVMPCVLPVLTLKLYGLVAHGDHGAGERRTAGMAYTAGILVSFWVLAAIVLALQSVGGGGWGFQFQYPGYVAALGAIVFAFGLSMFGVFEIPVVGANSLEGAAGKSGVAGHFMTGVFATLLGTPCSAPFLGPAIGFAFSQPPAVVALFFTVVGLGLAAPFLLVAFVPALFRFMPQPGAWMDTFKQLMGFTLIATTVWLVDVLAAQVGPDGVTGYLAFLATVGLGAWLFGRYGGLGETGGRQATAAFMGLSIVALGGFAFLELDFAEEPVCEAEVAHDGLVFDEEIPWQPFSDAAVASLVGKPIFVDFTAEWCLTCKVNEKTVLETASVRDAMGSLGIVPLKADWTRQNPEITAWLQRFGRAGVPFYLVIPADTTQAPIPLPEVITPDMVVTALKQGAAKTASVTEP